MSTRNGQLAQGALLVGSVPLANSDAVFRAASAALGAQLRRLPDGETGERTYWMVFQLPLLAKNPAFRAPLARVVGPFLRAYARSPLVRRIANGAMAGSQAGGMVFARVKPGVRIDDIRLGPLGYAAAAAESYRHFKRLRVERVIPPHIRFQVALPTPLAPLDFFSAADQARLAPVFEARLLEEVNEIAALVPPRELAIQWDTAVEFAMLEGVWPTPFGSPAQSRQPIVDMLVRIGNAVPAEVELGYHLCYGDAAHKHFKEPRDAGKLADVSRGITERPTLDHFPYHARGWACMTDARRASARKPRFTSVWCTRRMALPAPARVLPRRRMSSAARSG